MKIYLSIFATVVYALMNSSISFAECSGSTRLGMGPTRPIEGLDRWDGKTPLHVSLPVGDESEFSEITIRALSGPAGRGSRIALNVRSLDRTRSVTAVGLAHSAVELHQFTGIKWIDLSCAPSVPTPTASLTATLTTSKIRCAGMILNENGIPTAFSRLLKFSRDDETLTLSALPTENPPQVDVTLSGASRLEVNVISVPGGPQRGGRSTAASGSIEGAVSVRNIDRELGHVLGVRCIRRP